MSSHLANDHFKTYSLVCVLDARCNTGVFFTETLPENKSGNVPSMASWPVWPLKLVKVVSRSNDYQKLIDLITFCKALDRLASVASICTHSHHEGPEVSVVSDIPAAL